MLVTCNAGHHQQLDSGAVNPYNGLRECDVAYDITQLVIQYLNAAGINTNFVQEDSLADVVAAANDNNADLFISIHCNAFNEAAKGTETLVYGFGGEAEKLAECVQNQIVNSLGTVDRGLKERPGLYVLKHTDMPAILIETAFIDNNEDVQLLMNNQDDFARAIARGITDYQLL